MTDLPWKSVASLPSITALKTTKAELTHKQSISISSLNRATIFNKGMENKAVLRRKLKLFSAADLGLYLYLDQRKFLKKRE